MFGTWNNGFPEGNIRASLIKSHLGLDPAKDCAISPDQSREVDDQFRNV